MDVYRVGDEGDDIRITADLFQLPSQIIRLPFIVGVEKSYPSTFGLSNPCISRRTHPTIRLVDDRNCSAIWLKRLKSCVG